MLARNLIIFAITVLFSLALGGMSLANELGTEAGGYEFSFSSSDPSVDMQSLTQQDRERLAVIGTEAGNWQQTAVDDDALQAAIQHNRQHGPLVGIGSEAGNDSFEFEKRQDLICEIMLC